jgi:hypothetical protein
MLQAGITAGEIARSPESSATRWRTASPTNWATRWPQRVTTTRWRACAGISIESIRLRINRWRPSRGYMRSFWSLTRRAARCVRRRAEHSAFPSGSRPLGTDSVEQPRHQIALDRRAEPTQPLHINDVMQQLAPSCPSASDEQQPRLTDRPDGLHHRLHSPRANTCSSVGGGITTLNPNTVQLGLHGCSLVGCLVLDG